MPRTATNTRTRKGHFFHGRTAVVLSHGFLKKQSAVPPIEIERALRRKAAFVADPQLRTASGKVPL